MKPRILVILGSAGIICLLFAAVSCSVGVPPLGGQEIALPAIPATRNHDARGHYFLPPCPRCGAAPIDIFTGYHCPARHHYETPTTTLAAP